MKMTRRHTTALKRAIELEEYLTTEWLRQHPEDADYAKKMGARQRALTEILQFIKELK